MDETKEIFNEYLQSSMHVKSNYKSKKIDYTWMEKFEHALPYIDNILRNPKKFIVNEEEVVPVEKSKKVTVESIIYLSQHTNLIQDINEKTGDVKPSKVLNINKEESVDMYENRFVYTLIKHMSVFYEQHAPNMLGGSSLHDVKKATYEAFTKMGSDNIKVSVNFSSENHEDLDKDLDKSKGSVEDRLKYIKNNLDGFRGSDVYTTLDRMHIQEVRSPIKKTNAIRKNPNFIEANQLWDYIQSYTNDELKVEEAHNDYMDNGDIRAAFDSTFLEQYLSMNTLNEEQTVTSEEKAISMALAKVIADILDIDDKLMISKVKTVFSKEFNMAKEQVQKRNKRIVKIMNKKLADASLDIYDSIKKLR